MGGTTQLAAGHADETNGGETRGRYRAQPTGRDRDRLVFPSSTRSPTASVVHYRGLFSLLAACPDPTCLSVSPTAKPASPSPSADDVAATVVALDRLFPRRRGWQHVHASFRKVVFSAGAEALSLSRARARGASATSTSATPLRRSAPILLLPSRAAMARKRQGRIYSDQTGCTGPW